MEMVPAVRDLSCSAEVDYNSFESLIASAMATASARVASPLWGLRDRDWSAPPAERSCPARLARAGGLDLGSSRPDWASLLANGVGQTSCFLINLRSAAWPAIGARPG